MATSKFTAEVRESFIERVAAGVSTRDACNALELREKTVKGWLARGRREASGAYADFAAAVEVARDEAKARPGPMDEDELILVVSEMARKGSVQAAKLRWEMISATHGDEDEEPEDDFDSLDEDELAQARSRREAA